MKASTWGESHLIPSVGCTAWVALSGRPATTSGLAMVTDAPVFMVSRNGLSPTHPSACRLSCRDFPTCWGCNEKACVVKLLPPSSFLLSLSVASVDFFLLGVSPSAVQPTHFSRWVVPSCYNWSPVNMVPWALWSYMLRSSCLCCLVSSVGYFLP
jgi:hypothetical protein